MLSSWPFLTSLRHWALLCLPISYNTLLLVHKTTCSWISFEFFGFPSPSSPWLCFPRTCGSSLGIYSDTFLSFFTVPRAIFFKANRILSLSSRPFRSSQLTSINPDSSCQTSLDQTHGSFISFLFPMNSLSSSKISKELNKPHSFWLPCSRKHGFLCSECTFFPHLHLTNSKIFSQRSAPISIIGFII